MSHFRRRRSRSAVWTGFGLACLANDSARPCRIRPHRSGDRVMAKEIVRVLRSEADYDAALEEIERYFEREPEPGTPDADRFDLLALIIEDYDRKRWPIEPPDAIDAIPLPHGDGRLYPGRSRPPARFAPARIRCPEGQASPDDEHSVAAAPRVGHSGRGADRAVAAARTKLCGVDCAEVRIEAVGKGCGGDHGYSSVSCQRGDCSS